MESETFGHLLERCVDLVDAVLADSGVDMGKHADRRRWSSGPEVLGRSSIAGRIEGGLQPIVEVQPCGHFFFRVDIATINQQLQVLMTH